MASPSYRERTKAARAEARAQRLAAEAAWQREIELRYEIRKLAREAVLYAIRAAGQRVQNYTPAEIEREARGFICEWVVAKAKKRIAERNLRHSHSAQRPAAQALSLCESHVRNGAAK
jgi:hypothetical protein